LRRTWLPRWRTEIHPSLPRAATSRAPETTGGRSVKLAATACAERSPSVGIGHPRGAPQRREPAPPQRSQRRPRGCRPACAVLATRARTRDSRPQLAARRRIRRRGQVPWCPGYPLGHVTAPHGRRPIGVHALGATEPRRMPIGDWEARRVRRWPSPQRDRQVTRRIGRRPATTCEPQCQRTD